MMIRIRKSCLCALLVFAAVMSLTGCGTDVKKQRAYRDKGVEALYAGEYEKAEDYFDKALQEAGAYVTEREINISYYKAAAQYLGLDRKGAIMTYTNLIAYDAHNAEAYFLRGSLYMDESETDKGLADYHKAAEVSDGDYELHMEIYENLCAMGYGDDAAEFLNLALEIEGDDAENYFNRGRIYMLLSQYEVAKTTLQKAVDKGSNEAKVYLAEVYDMQGDAETAKQLMDEYAHAGKVSGSSLAMVGNLLLEQGAYEEALEIFENALSDDDIDSKKELLKGEIAALEYTGDFATAKEKANDFIESYPSDGEILRELIFLNTR